MAGSLHADGFVPRARTLDSFSMPCPAGPFVHTNAKIPKLMTDAPQLRDFPLQTSDKIRYGDTDRQGHVNNAVFATLLETGRVEFLYHPSRPLAEPGSAFVIARLELNFRSELTWPGSVCIGTRVVSVGRSSITLAQGLFQDEQCAATAETVIVLMDEATRRARALSAETRRTLSTMAGPHAS